jgi:hypothetical protein
LTRDDTEFAGLPMAVLAPNQNVSGPILALLTLLKHRPNTQVFGVEIVSYLQCRGSFDLPDQDGAISNLAYARFTPDMQYVAQDSHLPSQQLLEIAGQIRFAPHESVADPKAVPKLATDWLATHAKTDGS